MAKKKPGTGKQDDDVEEEELAEEKLDEETSETDNDESETDDTADDETGDDERDEDETDDEPTVEDLMAQLSKMQRALKKANREAAKRRKELEALKKKPESEKKVAAKVKAGDDEADELRQLREQNETLLAEQRRTGARLAIAKAARRAKINWANDQARDDAIELVLREAEINDDGSIDDVADLLTDVIEDRPHLLAAKADKKPPRAGDTSATRRGGSKDLALDEDEIAQQYGIRDHRPTQK